MIQSRTRRTLRRCAAAVAAALAAAAGALACTPGGGSFDSDGGRLSIQRPDNEGESSATRSSRARRVRRSS